MRKFPLSAGFSLLTTLLLPSLAPAGPRSAAVREVAEYVLQQFGKEATGMGLESLTRKTEQLVIQYGPQALQAVRNVGPRTFRLVEGAGEHGDQAVRLLAQHGPQAAGLVSRREALALVARHGDGIAEALLRHPGIAEPLIGRLGDPAVDALRAIKPRNARRLALMQQSGELARIGRTGELLGVIAQYGDRACDWIWRNKGGLTMASVLAAFLADPEPFLDGARDLAGLVAEAAIRPIAEVPKAVATEAARRTNWALIALVGGSLAGFAWCLLKGRRR
jgi:hypothetical protein